MCGRVADLGAAEGWRVVEAACLAREDRSMGPYRSILDRPHRWAALWDRRR